MQIRSLKQQAFAAFLALGAFGNTSYAEENQLPQDVQDLIKAATQCTPSDNSEPYLKGYTIDQNQQQVEAEIRERLDSNPHMRGILEDFNEKSGKIFIICIPESERDTFSPGAGILNRAQALYDNLEDKQPLIYAQNMLGISNIAALTAHELEHHEADTQGLNRTNKFEDGQIPTLTATVYKMMLDEASAQTSATDFAYQDFLNGDPNALISFLHNVNLQIAASGDPNLTPYSFTQNMVRAYINTMYGFDDYPESLTMNDLAKIEPISDPNIRQKAQAAAFATWFINTDSFTVSHIQGYTSTAA